MNNQHKLTLLDKAAEMMNEIISLERMAELQKQNIESNPIFDGLIPKWKKNLQFTKKRIQLFQYEYNNLINELYENK